MPMTSPAELKARRLIAFGAIVTFVGAVFITTGSKATGGPIIIAGWAALLYGIHAFGRLGSGDRS